MKFYTRPLHFIYTLFHYLILPIILVRLLWRSRRIAGYRHRWRERFGYIQPIPQHTRTIWLHAVSVGEAIAAVPLIQRIKKAYPDYIVVVTSTTPTGSAQVIKHFKDEVVHVYAPFDVPSCVNRFLDRIHPELFIVMETELWPNMLQACSKRKIPVMLANGRLSEKSMKSYQWIGSLTKKMLSSYSVVVAQGILDGERFVKLGLDPRRLVISGNVKFEFSVSDDAFSQSKTLREDWGAQQKPVWIAASTHAGEEEILLAALELVKKEQPHSLFILVPRHPERFDKVIRLCQDKGNKVALRSLKQKPDDETSILIGDTMGELRLMFGACDVAFVGGSLVPIGGHNMIEPAAYGLPVLSGAHVHNFVEISRLLKDAGVLQITNDAKSIASAVLSLFAAKDLRQKISARALEVVNTNRGALDKHLFWVQKLLSEKSA